MKNLAMLIEYDGSDYGGWQIQPNAKTIQEEIQSAIFELTGIKANLIGAGRTDAGVHSSGQTANVILPDEFPIPEEKVSIALNTKLPHDIRIKASAFVHENFHSRFDAKSREYEYNLHTKDSVFLNRFSTYYKFPLDIDALLTSAHIFCGKHDFTSFSKLNISTKSYVCNVSECKWGRTGEHSFKMNIKADRFVYGMVRALVGAMLDLASDRIFASDLLYALQNPSRNNFARLAPPQGLILSRIEYEKKLF
jgi:tRNA pseudouridine38-40 synthase